MTARARPHLFIDAGLAMTRAALVDSDRIIRLFEVEGVAPVTRRSPAFRDAVIGHVTHVSKPLKGAFVDIGDANEAFLPFGRKATPPVEGAYIVAIIKRPPIGGKGAVLGSDARAAYGVSSQEIDTALKVKRVGLVGEGMAGAAGVFRYIDPTHVEGVTVTTPEAMNAVARIGGAIDVTLETDLARSPDIHAAIDMALEREQPLPGGGRLIIDETEGGCVIDIDSGASSETSSASNDQANLDAAAALFDAIGRRNIGGRVIVDFIQPSKPAAKAALQSAVESAAAARPDVKLGILRNDGLFDMTAPRTALSFSGRARSDADWKLRHALAKLEWRMRKNPKRRFTLALPTGLFEALDVANGLRAAYAATYPARFAVERTELPEADIVEKA